MIYSIILEASHGFTASRLQNIEPKPMASVRMQSVLALHWLTVKVYTKLYNTPTLTVLTENRKQFSWELKTVSSTIS